MRAEVNTPATAQTTVPELAAVVMLAVSGAVFLPGALNRFVFPKVALAAVGIALALTAPARGRLPPMVRVLLFAGSAWLVLAALAGAEPVAQLLGRPPRYEGIFVLAVYLGAGVCGARLLGPAGHPDAAAWFLDGLAVAAILIGLEAVLEAAGLRPLASDVARPGSLLGNASDEGAWGLLALGPLTVSALRGGNVLRVLGALAAAAAVVCSGSRGALLGGLLATGLMVWRLGPGPVRGRLIAATVLAVLSAFTVPATRARVVGSSPYSGRTATGRLLLAGETGRLIVASPVLGAGPSGFVDQIPAHHNLRYEEEIGPSTPPDSPHDWLLQAGASGGLPLLALALRLAGLTLARGRRRLLSSEGGGGVDGEDITLGALCGLIGYGVALLFFFTTPGSTPLAAVVGGARLAAGPAPAPESRAGSLFSRWSRRVGATGFALVAIVLVLAAAAELPLRAATDAAARLQLARANHDFHLAHDLRPWDSGVDTAAAHAFAALAEAGFAPAARDGAAWARRALAATPDSIEVLTDAAELDRVAGRREAAAELLARARRLDPANPNLRRDDVAGLGANR